MLTKQSIKHICVNCGTEFYGRTTTKFCSSICRSKYWNKKRAKIRYCIVCGKKLSNGKRKFCSSECRFMKICPICGIKFNAKDQRQKYCSRKCQHKSMKQIGNFVCKNCGKEFIPKSSERITFCSRECAFNYRKINTKRQCIVCGRKLTLKQIKYCSEECKRKNSEGICKFCGKKFYKRNCLSKFCSLDCQKKYYYKKKQKQFISFKCKECGKQVIIEKGPGMRYKFCSQLCFNRHENRKKEIKRRHKLYQNGNIDYDITLNKLFERDNGVCYLCGGQVNMNADPNSDWYGSIDHVVPISKSGTHTWDNVKLAHRKCNYVKNDRELVEQIA